MYNRYIRGDSGQYQRIPVPDPPPPPPPPPPPDNGGYDPFHRGGGPHYGNGSGYGGPPPPGGPPPGGPNGKPGGILSGILRQLNLEHILERVDTGDLLLILILLFKDGEDEEMLIALGLLLIL